MKKAIVVSVVVFMLCVSMSSVAVSETAPSNLNLKEKNIVSGSYRTVKKSNPDPDALEHLQEAVDNYLKMDENSFTPYETPEEDDIDIPRIGVTGMMGDFVSWWVRINYNGQNFSKEVDITSDDLRNKFLEWPKHHEILFFDIDEDDADDVEVRVGFYWKYYYDPLNPEEMVKGLEFKFIVDQTSTGNPGGGIADPYASLSVWSEISLNVGLIKNLPVNKPLTYNVNKFINKFNKFGLSATSTPLKNLLERILSTSQKEVDNSPLNDPVPLDADSDYLSMGAGYRSPEGSKIPQTVMKKYWFARESIFSPTIFQHTFDPDGSDPIELLYDFLAYKGGHTDPSYYIEFSIKYEPAVYLRTMFIPLKGYVRYYFMPKSKTSDETTITFSSNLLEGVGEGIQLQLIFDEIDSSLAYAGRWFSFDFDIFDKFMYRASNKFTVSFQVVSPWLSEKIKLRGIPTSIDFHRREWSIQFDIVQGELLELEVLVETKLIMNSKLDEFILYYPKADPDDPDLTLLDISSIPSTETFSAYGHLDIVNSTYVTVELEGYVELSMSSQLGKIELFNPQEFILLEIEGIPAREKVGAKGIVHYKRGDLYDKNNYVFGRAYRDFSSNLDAINFYLPNVEIPIVRITDIPADANAEGKFYWNKLEGYAKATRQSAGAVDPIAFYLELDQFTISNVLEIRDGYINTNFKIAKDGYFTLDTSNEMINNTLEISNSETGNSLAIEATTASADNFDADWTIVESGGQIEIQDLSLTGALKSLKNFDISIELEGKNSHFYGEWDIGEKAGGFEIEFSQDEPVTLDFNLDKFENFDFYGNVTLAQNLHFDMSWDLKQGGSENDPGYFYINKYTNDPNIEEVSIVATYKDQYGVDILAEDILLIVSVEWWRENNKLKWNIWWHVGVNVKHIKLLWNYEWYNLYP